MPSTFTRRQFFGAGTMLLVGAALSSCTNMQSQAITRVLEAAATEPTNEFSLAVLGTGDARALNRLSFGPTRADRAFVQSHGRSAWIEQQLDPISINDHELDLRLSPFDITILNSSDIHDFYSNLFDEVDSASAIQEFRQVTLLRQIYSHRQLYERMVEFWGDHFNIYIEKGDSWYLKPVDDREVIRKHALGNFRELLWASAHSPAMLVYLDNQANRAGAPNENYARELLELHTLGIDAGYSQQDVQTLARCLTGWRVNESSTLTAGEYVFDSDIHDNGPKQLLGMTITSSGQQEAEQVIDDLALHPSTAQFISTKLARRFIGDNPPRSVVQRTAAAFLRSRGDIRATLRALLLDQDWQTTTPKFKRPLQLVTSALRAIEGQTDAGVALQMHLAQMGQAAYGCATPDGYPERSESWQRQIMPRWQFALALAQGDIAGTHVPLSSVAARLGTQSIEQAGHHLAHQILGADLPVEQHRNLLSAIAGEQSATDVASSSDDSQMLQLQTLLAALWASPQFQWC